MLSEQSRIRRLRRYFKNLGEVQELNLQEQGRDVEDEVHQLTVINVGPADDPDNPLPVVNPSEAEVATGRAVMAEVDAKIESDKG